MRGLVVKGTSAAVRIANKELHFTVPPHRSIKVNLPFNPKHPYDTKVALSKDSSHYTHMPMNPKHLYEKLDVRI
jgi:hypothetical protein